MARNRSVNRRLVSTLMSGAKDIPKNASWLAGKALPHEHESRTSSNNGTADSRGLVRRAGDAVRDALPGQDSVEAALARAREGAQRATEAEDRAVTAAEEARARLDHADAVAAEEKQRLQDLEKQRSVEIDRRVAEATREAEERVAQARREAEADTERDLVDEQEASARREESARREAERAQQEAHERLAEATERLAQAKALAEEAAAMAQDAAEQARADADRISAAARQGREHADDALTRAQQLREQSEQEAASVTRTVNRTARKSRAAGGNDAGRAGALTAMSKTELVQLAQQRDVPGRSSMSKKQLVSALEKKQ
jgi:colicin import membrane protein